LLFLWAGPTFAGNLPAPAEPSFCVPDAFLAHETAEPGTVGIKRLRIFRFGGVVLAGMAIGESDVATVARLAENRGLTAADRFCTWYVNRGNFDAERLFHQVYLPNPSSLSPTDAAEVYGELFGASLGEGTDGVWSCLREKGFLAVGCNGQLHRGPTAFGMVLAALGCAPENAAEIVNRLWGLNGVPAESRLAAIRRAHELGARQPELRAGLQRLLADGP
jgi:hypothetical protein